GCMLAAFHPDLVSASMSGTETALATLVASGLVLAIGGGGAARYGVLCFAAPFVRGELTALCLALPPLFFIRRDRRRLLTTTVAACLGTAFAYGIIGARRLAVSGGPPALASWASLDGVGLGPFDAAVIGFAEILGRLPVVDSSILLLTAL